jgi:hypothetical protein
MASSAAPAQPTGDAASCPVLPARHRRPARPGRAVFYGRTNAVGAAAAVIVARQFRLCEDAAGHAVITGVFYDAAGGVSPTLTRMVRELEPLAARDGGWAELAAEITRTDHPVTMIVCESPDRIARRLADLRARLYLPARHGVTLLLAGVSPYEAVTADVLERLAGISSPHLTAKPRSTADRRGRDRPR